MNRSAVRFAPSISSISSIAMDASPRSKIEDRRKKGVTRKEKDANGYVRVPLEPMHSLRVIDSSTVHRASKMGSW